MAFGKASNIQGDDGMIRKLHELEMRLNGIEHVYLKELERRIAEVAMNAVSAAEYKSTLDAAKSYFGFGGSPYLAPVKTFTKQQIEDAAADCVPVSFGKNKAAAKKGK